MSLIVCRSCLESGGDLLSLQGVHKQSFMDLAAITVKDSDGLPQSICAECSRQLSQFSFFREKVIRNHQFLLEATEQRKAMESNGSTTYTEDTLDHIQVEIKEESLDDFPTADVLQSDIRNLGDDTVNLTEGTEDMEKIVTTLKRKIRKKGKDDSNEKCNKTSKKLNTQSKIPRVIVEVDPNKITTIRLSLEEQQKRHEAERTSSAYLAMPHRCDKCYKGFNYVRKLSTHIEKYHKEGGDFECKICRRTLVNAASLALHAARHDTLYECRVCLQRCVEKKQAVAHYLSEHEGIRTQVQCKYCGQTFRHRSTLNGHLRSRHPPGERPTCHLCDKSFVSKDSLLDHLLIHSGEKAHACVTCGKRFRLKAEVVVHARTHATSRPFYCQPCDKHFKTHTSYNNHRRLARAHLDTNTLEHVCSSCGRGFPAAWQLRAHAATHGGGGHACPQCDARLSSRAAVRKHVRSAHLRIPPPRNHVCHACGKRFSGSVMLENHIRVHTGDKPFVCAAAGCGARFSQKSTLQTHTRLVHLKLRRGAGGGGAGGHAAGETGVTVSAATDVAAS